MQFVAASKLKRAQDATLAARPYSEKLDEVLADLAPCSAARTTRSSPSARAASA
jgi:F0F1-type ATP synthase gamma subunit